MSSARRSSRQSASSSNKKKSMIPPSIRRGLESLVDDGNDSYICKLLSLDTSTSSSSGMIVNALEECMSMNNLTAEMLLARFFDVSVLSQYCTNIIGKSGKGSTATLAARIAKEWSKNDFGETLEKKRKKVGEEEAGSGDNNNNNDNVKKPKKSKKDSKESNEGKEGEDDDYCDDDWRNPLFFWKGILTYDKVNNALQWEGSWVSDVAENGVPDEKQFQASKETSSFQLLNKGKLVRASSSQSSIENQPFLGMRGAFKGSYFLDQDDGNGPRKFQDLSHHFCFSDEQQVHEEDVILVAASGTTGFGNFVSAGYIRPLPSKEEDGKSTDSVAAELLLARRYIDEDDSRVAWKNKPALVLESFSKTKPDDKSFWMDCLPRKS